jgi:hypothetical protein
MNFPICTGLLLFETETPILLTHLLATYCLTRILTLSCLYLIDIGNEVRV